MSRFRFRHDKIEYARATDRGIKGKNSSGVLFAERAGETGDLQLGGIFHRDRRKEKKKRNKRAVEIGT